MSKRFSAPWGIVKIPSGFAVEDATGQQLGVFYGRSDPNTAGHTGFLTIDEARQLAVDFARLPKLLKRTSARSEFMKARPQHKTASRMRAHTLNGRQTPRKLERLLEDLALRPKILEPARGLGGARIKRTVDLPSSALRPRRGPDAVDLDRFTASSTPSLRRWEPDAEKDGGGDSTGRAQRPT
jgi:hypothetical protein